MRWIDRLGALAGIPGAVLVVVFVGMAEPLANPESPSSVVAKALVDNRDSARAAAYVALLAAFFLILFVSRLYGALREASGPNAWLPTVVLVGGVLLIGWILVESGFSFAASELQSYGQETQLARLFILWSWNSASLLAPSFAALLAGSTLVAFSARTFPMWFRWASLVLLVLMVLIAVLLRAPGLATAPGTLWIVLASAMLALQRSPRPPAAIELPSEIQT